ncbi:MAG: SDR family oxidoreductase, partial [Gemmatimonadota bacterium]|nr:SDR family oxidoreductase [Gemmatimonadota bacterium]
YADSDTSFYVRRTPWRLVFQRDETGRVSGAVADLAGTERRMPRRDDDLPDPRVLAGNLVASTAVVALSPEEMARYEGDYVVAMGSTNVRFRVFVENGELMAQPDAQRSTRLLRQAEHTFVTAVDTDIRLVFAVENGRAERVTLHQSGQSASGPRLEPGEEPPPPPAQPEVLDLPVTPEDIARYEGTYLLAVGERTLELRIFGRDGALISQAAGQNESPLRHQGDHVFVPGFDDRVRVVFTVENDRAVSLTLHQGGGVFEGPRVPSVAGEQSGGAILITGASSGLGRATAETLASKGYFVYAGARSEEDLRALNAIDNIEAIRLDVTIQSEIDAAVQTVIDGGRGLHAIVNNAGVGLMSPLIELEEDDLDFILDVNVYGPYRITRAFAPLLIESGGRVVNIGSIAGFQTTSFYGPYSISKHALEAYTDALAIELAKFGIRVSIIDPGGFNSDIGRNIYERLQASDVDIEGSLYSEEWQSNWVLGGGDLSGAPGPEFIVEIIEHALFDDDPQQRYMVVGDPGRAERTMRSLFRRMLQLNQNQPYTYDRDGLIELLDAEIARMEGDLRR